MQSDQFSVLPRQNGSDTFSLTEQFAGSQQPSLLSDGTFLLPLSWLCVRTPGTTSNTSVFLRPRSYSGGLQSSRSRVALPGLGGPFRSIFSWKRCPGVRSVHFLLFVIEFFTLPMLRRHSFSVCHLWKIK